MGPKAPVQGPVRRKVQKSLGRRQRADSIPTSIASSTHTLVEESVEDCKDVQDVEEPKHAVPIRMSSLSSRLNIPLPTLSYRLVHIR